MPIIGKGPSSSKHVIQTSASIANTNSVKKSQGYELGFVPVEVEGSDDEELKPKAKFTSGKPIDSHLSESGREKRQTTKKTAPSDNPWIKAKGKNYSSPSKQKNIETEEPSYAKQNSGSNKRKQSHINRYDKLPTQNTASLGDNVNKQPRKVETKSSSSSDGKIGIPYGNQARPNAKRQKTMPNINTSKSKHADIRTLEDVANIETYITKITLHAGITSEAIEAIPRNVVAVKLEGAVSPEAIVRLPKHVERVTIGKGVQAKTIEAIPSNIYAIGITSNSPLEAIKKIPERIKAIALASNLTNDMLLAIPPNVLNNIEEVMIHRDFHPQFTLVLKACLPQRYIIKYLD